MHPIFFNIAPIFNFVLQMLTALSVSANLFYKSQFLILPAPQDKTKFFSRPQ
jgi:hypothetical protein